MKTILRITAAALITAAMSLAGMTSAPASSPKWLQIAAGYDHTCAIRADHALFCWGTNSDGQLGTGGTSEQLTLPARVGSSTSWKSVSTGHFFTCALHNSGSIYCWGNNLDGVLGQGTTDGFLTSPKKVGTSTSWKSLSVGFSHVCALHSSGSVYCWGSNAQGRLGTGDTVDRSKPTKVGKSTSWTSVDAGGSQTCATHHSGAIYCWGDNYYGQLGTGDVNERHAPTKVGTSTGWARVSAGKFHTCALKDSGALYCWGYNNQGQLGTHDTIQRLSPTHVGSSTSWKSIVAGGNTSCATHSGSTLYCWGSGDQGQVGDGSGGDGYDVEAPTRIDDDVSWSNVSVGDEHTCAVATSGYAYCWGFGDHGRLGNNSTDGSYLPIKIRMTVS